MAYVDAACEAPRLVDESNLANLRQPSNPQAIHIDVASFVTECKALHEAKVTLLQICYIESFFSSRVNFYDRRARCLSDFFTQFALNIRQFGGSGHRELSQLKLINIVVNRDSYARISGRL